MTDPLTPDAARNVLPRLTDAEVAELQQRKRFAKLLRLVAINAYGNYLNSCAIGNPAPSVAALGERIKRPQPGDVVLETSTIWRWAKHADETPLDQFPALGVLLRVTREPFPLEPDEEDEGQTEEVVYVAPLDGSVPEYRWTNAMFIRVVDGLEMLR